MTNRRSSVAKITMVGADIMSLLILYILKYIVYIYSIKLFVHYINVREYQRGQSKFDNPEKNWQHSVHKTKKNKTKTQHNMC
jgi:hypothetical protein